MTGSSKHPDSLLDVVPPPQGHKVELVPAHLEHHLEVLIVEVLLQVAPVHVRWQLIVGVEQHYSFFISARVTFL